MLKKGLLLLGVLVMASIFATGFEILYSMDEYAYDVYPRSLYIKGWVMYGISQKEFYVFDISSPSKIEVVKKIDLYDFLEGDIMKVITGYGEKLYILCEKSIIVYDISTPESPKLVAKRNSLLTYVLGVSNNPFAGLNNIINEFPVASLRHRLCSFLCSPLCRESL